MEKKNILTADRLFELMLAMETGQLLIHRHALPGLVEFIIAPAPYDRNRALWSISVSNRRAGFSGETKAALILRGFFSAIIDGSPDSIEKGEDYERLFWTIPKDGSDPAQMPLSEDLKPGEGQVTIVCRSGNLVHAIRIRDDLIRKISDVLSPSEAEPEKIIRSATH